MGIFYGITEHFTVKTPASSVPIAERVRDYVQKMGKRLKLPPAARAPEYQ